ARTARSATRTGASRSASVITRCSQTFTAPPRRTTGSTGPTGTPTAGRRSSSTRKGRSASSSATAKGSCQSRTRFSPRSRSSGEAGAGGEADAHQDAGGAENLPEADALAHQERREDDADDRLEVGE